MLVSTREKAKQEALEYLREICPPGTKVFTHVTHVTRSGNSRSIDFLIVSEGDIVRITHYVADAFGDNIDTKHGGVKNEARSQNIGFAMVMDLAFLLHGFQDIGDLQAGYTLKHIWI